MRKFIIKHITKTQIWQKLYNMHMEKKFLSSIFCKQLKEKYDNNNNAVKWNVFIT